MKRLTFAAWEHWWLRAVPPHAMAIVRISVGLFLLVYAFTFIPFTTLLFSTEGLVLPLYINVVPSPLIAWLLILILVLALTLFTLGFYYHIATFIIIVLALYFWQLQLHLFPTSYNRLFFFLLLTLLWSGADQTLSVKQWRQNGSWLAWEPICVLPQRLIAVQVTATYLGVGLQKLVLVSWQSGDILLYSFMGFWATPLAFWLVQLKLPSLFYDLSVQVVTLFEVVLPFGLWYPPWRRLTIVGAVLFHIFITAFLAIWWFIALFPLYLLFYKPEVIQAWVDQRFSTKTRA